LTEPLVVILGFMADTRSFLPQLVFLGRTRPLILLSPGTADTVEQLATQSASLLPPAFALLGHGLGGNVAIEILRRQPDAVSRIALIATDPLPEPATIAAAREAQVVAAKSGRLAEAMLQAQPATALADTEWRDDVLALVQDMAAGLGPDQFQRQSRTLQRRPDQQKTLRKAAMPALVLCGEADTIVPRRRAEFMAGMMPQGCLEIIPDAGHLPQLEQPEAVSRALETFFDGRLPPLLLR
jgi:pimeloyl-ACP methyl ester carboxylesterase